jgi:hypothetical protein
VRAVIIWFLLFATTAILLSLACSRKHTAPDTTMRGLIQHQLDRIRPLLSTSEFEVSGDALLFSGLLTLIHEDWACDIVRRSQFEDGSFARSPAHRDRGDRDFSRDQGLGVLMAIQSGCVPPEPFAAFLNAPNAPNAQPEGCLSRSCDAKARAGGHYLKLVEVVTRTWIRGSSSVWGTAGIGIGSWANTDYALHLDSLSLYLYDRNNISTLGTSSARHALAKRQPDNPWFLYVVGDKEGAANKLLPLMRSFDPAKVPTDWLDWIWQRPTEQWGTRTFANGWDLLLLGELLVE